VNSSNATRYANHAEANKCYAHFTQLVAVVAEHHQNYLHQEGLTLADCYQLTFRYANARLQLNPKLLPPLYEALRQCFVESFG
jgi:glutathione S-transferase